MHHTNNKHTTTNNNKQYNTPTTNTPNTTINNSTSDANDICDGDILVLRSISKVEAATCLHACCGAIIKLNAKGSGSSGLDVVGLPEVFTESFRLLPHDAEIFRACHDSGRIII